MQQVHNPHAAQICRDLQSQLTGSCDFSSAAVAMYASDASNYRQLPLGVVYPANSDDIQATLRLCQQYKHAILMRGGGTSQNGQCVNNAVVIDCSRHLRRVLDIDTNNRTALVEPGIVCDALKAHAEEHGLTFGPDPATHSRCTLGGMIGNNSCGPHSMLAGKTVENVLELKVLTNDGAVFWVGPTSDSELQSIIAAGGRQGEIYKQLKDLRDEYADDIRQHFPNIKRRVSGFNLDQLLPENGFNVARALVGSEGTCVSVLEARVRLIENPAHVQLVVLGFNDIFLAGDTVPDIMPFTPIAMEGLDWNIVGGLIDRNLRAKEIDLLPPGRAWILVELAASSEQALQSKTTEFVAAMQQCHTVHSVLSVHEAEQVQSLWSIREQGASATALALNPGEPDPIVGWEDTAVDPMQLGDYLRALYALVERYEYKTSLYGHFGDGCIHARMTFDTRSKQGVEKWRRFSTDIAKLVVQFGGSLSGEHGDGQAKAEFLPIMFGDRLVKAFEQYKHIWDPHRLMNPGKVVNAFKMDDNLRYGPNYKTPVVNTTLQFVSDAGGFGRASERCIGMGKCRSASGTMCPSYQATHEERYSTRGRARLLHELVRGEVFDSNGWQNDAIADSLEHCLSCKACKTSCPTQVDIASYKAEFMHKRYKNGKRRPLQHHLFGKITRWLPYFSRFPRVSNRLQSGSVGLLAKRVLGLHKQSVLPALASSSFSDWVQNNASEHDDAFYWFGERKNPSVALWVDSVNAHYAPHVLASAVTVMLRSGFRVGIARSRFCCGRPLFEFGFLDEANQQFNKLLQQFYPLVSSMQAVLVLEPSCRSTFKDEMLRLYPNDSSAAKLAELIQSPAEFLLTKGIKPSKKLDEGMLHVHCHDKSLASDSAERTWMQMCFKTLSEPEQGCCGMAGTFGLKASTRSIAQTLLNRELVPAVAASSKDATIVSNGFSCRHHITVGTRKAVLHPVEIIEKCL